MRTRCENQQHKSFQHYGLRGIRVCEEWSKFENFERDMGESYKPGLTLERKDNNAGYSKNNCVWVSRKLNVRNRRSTLKITLSDGKLISLAEAAEKHGLKYGTLYARLFTRGWPLEKALERRVA